MPNALLATPLKLDSKGAGKHAWLLGGLNDEAFSKQTWSRMVARYITDAFIFLSPSQPYVIMHIC